MHHSHRHRMQPIAKSNGVAVKVCVGVGFWILFLKIRLSFSFVGVYYRMQLTFFFLANIISYALILGVYFFDEIYNVPVWSKVTSLLF